jgi:hypothetical protein
MAKTMAWVKAAKGRLALGGKYNKTPGVNK